MTGERMPGRFVRWLNSIHSTRALAAGFGLIVLVMVSLAVIALERFSEVRRDMETVVDVYNVRTELAQTMRVTARERAPLLFILVNTDDPFVQEELIERFGELGSRFLIARERLLASGLDETERRLLEAHRDFARTIVPNQRRVIELARDGHVEEAERFLVEVVSPSQSESLAQLDAFIELEKRYSRRQMARAQESFKRTLKELGITALLGSLCAIGVALFVSIRLSHYVQELRHANEGLESRVAARTHELNEANQRLERLANYDTLTGLPNRAMFNMHLQQSLKRVRRYDRHGALLFIDLDGFKAVNDGYGHEYGDELLRQVGGRLSTVLRDSDIAARIGGDEFTLILCDLKADDRVAVERVAGRVVTILQEPFAVLDAECRIGASVGIALFPTMSDDLDELLSMADGAMYRVKGAGKNGYRIHGDEVLAAG